MLVVVLLLLAVQRSSACMSAPGCGLWPQGELARWAAAAGGSRRRFALGGADVDHAAALRRLALAALMHDRLQPHWVPRGLFDVLGLAGARLDADWIRVAHGRLLNALAPQERDEVEAALYVSGWTEFAPGWMLTTDAAGGFRQLRHFPQFRLAVSRSGKLAGPVATACPPPPGWRLATAAELRAAGFRDGGARAPPQNYYKGQAGWDGLKWGGVGRGWFVTADWAEVDPAAGGAVDAGDSEGDLAPSSGTEGDLPYSSATAAELRSRLPRRWFAGVVCARAD